MTSPRRLTGVMTLAAAVLLLRCTFAPDLSHLPSCSVDDDCTAETVCAKAAGVCVSRCGDVPCEPPAEEPLPPPALNVLGLSPPDAVEGIDYEWLLSAEHGTPPYVFAISAGALPPGIELAANGRLFGAAALPGRFVFELTVSDSAPERQTRRVSAALEVSPLLRVGTLGLIDGELDAPYLDALYATGGTPPYLWSLTPDGGTPPEGLSVHSDGGVRGLPGSVGTGIFSVSVRDSATPPQERQRELSVSIGARAVVVTLATPSLAEGRRGWPYSQRLQARGGQSPYMFRVVDGGFPPGVALDAITGNIDGTPDASGQFPVVLQTADSTGLSATRTYRVEIH